MPFIEHVSPPPSEECKSRSHNPPNMIVLPPGRHTWQCPDCGQTTTFYVDRARCSVQV